MSRGEQTSNESGPRRVCVRVRSGTLGLCPDRGARTLLSSGDSRLDILRPLVEDEGQHDGALNVPAQFTSLLGEGRLLYACHSSDAVFARFLRERKKKNPCQRPSSTVLPHALPVSLCLCHGGHRSCRRRLGEEWVSRNAHCGLIQKLTQPVLPRRETSSEPSLLHK